MDTTISTPSRRSFAHLPAQVALWAGALTLLDVAAVAAAGWILWMTGGSTVIDGSTAGQVGFVLLITGWATLRRLFVQRARWSSRGTAALAVPANNAVQLALIATLTTLWSITEIYYLGWLATLGAILVGIEALFRFIGAVATPGEQGGRRRHESRSAAGAGAIVVLTGAIVALLFTARIHLWDATVLNGLTLLVGAGTVIGVIAAAVLTRPGASAKLS
jgi:hypothetical protein